uniref:Uncharacterized protein n=1 Tax=Arion vulgaris TaxID=1028688 RepID=A0A0B6ZT21_9EUPU
MISAASRVTAARHLALPSSHVTASIIYEPADQTSHNMKAWFPADLHNDLEVNPISELNMRLIPPATFTKEVG